MAVRQSGKTGSGAAVAPGMRAGVDHQRLWDRIDALMEAIPPDVAQRLPEDGVEQLDHYVYGSQPRSDPATTPTIE